MDVVKKKFGRIKNISIRWKILAPFLFFALAGTAVITLFNLRSQQKLILMEEKNLMTGHFKDIRDRIDQKAEQALAIAVSIAENPEIGKLLSIRDRSSLRLMVYPSYAKLKEEFGVSQLNFYTSPGNPFLNLQDPRPSGDHSPEKAASDAVSRGATTACLKRDDAGLCITGTTPVYFNKAIAGSLEICIPVDKPFIEDYYAYGRINTALFDLKGPGDYRLIAYSGEKPAVLLGEIYPDGNIDDYPRTIIGPDRSPGKSIVTGPLKDCSGDVIALIELDMDRSEMLARSVQTVKILITIAVLGIAVSFLIAYLIVSFLTKPIREIAREAQEIAGGRREIGLEPRPGDEIGSLTDALNSMLDSLKNKQLKIEEYARTLESSVKERTAELLASEEKYRTLVENAPLIVYRVARDGTTEFVNSYLTENTGYTIEEAMSDRRFWRDKMAGIDQKAFDTINKSCFLEKKQCRIESRVMSKDGRMLTFITHAIPAKDAGGHVKWIDGIMLDITELKRLQEKAIQTEGIRTIGEISARMAHEIRNPLSAAGGFATRLRDSLRNDEVHRKMAEIIVEEIAKLENFVRILLSSIEPFELSISEVDVNGIFKYWLKDLEGQLASRNIRFVNDFETDMPKIMADRDRLSQSLGNILKHAGVSTPDGENIFISTFWLDDQILVTISHRVDRITASDMDKFFFPHVEHNMDKSLLDLPLSKIIIQRHGGKIELFREEGNILVMKIKFPLLR